MKPFASQFPLRLKWRLAIAMSLGALALVVGMGAVSMHFAQRDLLATLSNEQVGLVKRAGDDLDIRLKRAIDSLVTSALAMPLDAVSSAERFRRFQNEHPALLQYFDELVVIDAAGVITANFPAADGRIGIDVHDRKYFQRAMAERVAVVSEPLLARTDGMPLIVVAAPVFDDDAKIVALVTGVLRLDRNYLLGSLGRSQVGRTGWYAVMSHGDKPVYLAHPETGRLMQPVPTEKGRVFATALRATAAGVVLDRLDDGSEALVSYVPLASTPWTLIAVLPGSEAFATIEHSRHRTIVIGLVTALVSLPLMWLVGLRLLRPISVLQAEVERIAADPAGEIEKTLGRDEVGRVGRAFNAMLREQRRSEALRIASDQDRRRMVAILESSRDFVVMTDIEGHVTYLNAAGRLCCGVGLNDDLRHTTMVDYFAPWALERLRSQGVPTALRDGIWLGESAVIARDGREISCDHMVIAHRNVDGRLEFFSGLLHDTSAAKATSAALRSSEARMVSIANALPVLVSFIDCDYRFRFVNARYEDHFGIGRALILGKSVAEMIGTEAYAEYYPRLLKASTGETQVFEIESRAGVRPAHFLVKVIPQYDDSRELTGFHFIHQDVTDHKAEHQRLSQLVRADPLTGLLNRAGFEGAIAEAMQRSQNHLSAMALFYLDVDRFKSINDRYGHIVGDALLKAFADRLVRAVRSADVAARLGGDEFVVIAEGLRSIDDVRSIARKILRAMRTEFECNGQRLSVTTSIGVAAYAGEPIKAVALIERADAALYCAKNQGRDRFEIDDPTQTLAPSTGDPTQTFAFTSIV